MESFYIFVMVIATFICSTESSRICPENQVYSDCANPCYNPKCSDGLYTGVPPVRCNEECLPGCVCAGSCVLDDIENSGCSDIDECPKPCCPPNREYLECGSNYPPTCEQPNGLASDICIRGCFCNNGLVEDGNGNCIPLVKCPRQVPVCALNEIPDDCVNTFQPSCLDPNPQACPDNVCVSGCVCRPPFVRDLEIGICVDKATCDAKCPGKNEVWNPCGSSCPTTCDNVDILDRICTEECISYCECKPGYVLDCHDNCIPPEFCTCAASLHLHSHT